MHMLYSAVLTLQICLLENHCTVHHVEFSTISLKAVEGFFIYVVADPQEGCIMRGWVDKCTSYFCFTVISVQLRLCVPFLVCVSEGVCSDFLELSACLIHTAVHV